jgi:hypothetical protein
MPQQRSREELLKFLDYVASKGLMSPVTARSRKASANKVLGILSDDEAEDVTALDLDAVMVRFSNLEGRNYTPESLMTYKSRVKSSIEDFRSYLTNPLTFKSGTQTRERREGKSNGEKPAGAGRSASKSWPTASRPAEPPLVATNVLNIPLRADLTVRVHGIPFDMTPAEAKKIANVIVAMAAPVE